MYHKNENVNNAISIKKVLYLLFIFLCTLEYCKLVIIRHVPVFAIFISALIDEITYWRIIHINTHVQLTIYGTNYLACEILESIRKWLL